MKEFYALFGVRNLALPETEADDVIFALCRLLREQSIQARITVVSRDHDLIQVVQEGYATEVFDPVGKKNLEIPWYRITEYKALTGDSSDNLPGVSGIGPKTALKVFSGQYHLTEAQRSEYERMLDVIDAWRNPLLDRNLALVKGFLTTGLIN
jgi:DNA polymerase-1